MPKKTKVVAPEPEVAAPTNKSECVREALRDNPKGTPKEISDQLKASGVDVSPGYVSTIKFNMGMGKRKKKKSVASPAPVSEGPVVPKDAVSLALLQKAKKLAGQFGSLKEAKQAIDALSQLLD